jgi:hypothetical protein
MSKRKSDSNCILIDRRKGVERRRGKVGDREDQENKEGEGRRNGKKKGG